MINSKSDKKIEDMVFNHTDVYVKKSGVHGLGVFANKNFKLNDIIEIFPMLPLSFRTKYQADQVVYQYAYVNYTCECNECKRHGYLIYLPMGYGNLYNHQEGTQTNAKINTYFENFYAEVVAIQPIEKDSEIFLNYGLRYLFKDGKILNHENITR